MAHSKKYRFGGRVIIVHPDETLEEGTDISRLPQARFLAPLPPRYRDAARRKLGLE